MKTYVIADENAKNHRVILNLSMLMGEILEVTTMPDCDLTLDQPFVSSTVSVNAKNRLFILENINGRQISIKEYIPDERTHAGVQRSKDLVKEFRNRN